MRVELVYPAGLRPPVRVLGLHQALVLRVRYQVGEEEGLLVVEGGAHVAAGAVVAGDDDVGPVGAVDAKVGGGGKVVTAGVLERECDVHQELNLIKVRVFKAVAYLSRLYFTRRRILPMSVVTKYIRPSFGK